MSILGNIRKLLDAMLDTSYLFNEDNKRVHVNMQLLMVALIMLDTVNGVVSLFAHGPVKSWLGVLVPVAAGILVYVAVGKMRSAGKALTLVSFYMLVNMWLQFIFFGGLVNYQLFVIYPVAVCLLMGNAFAVKFIPLLFANTIICTMGWSSALELFTDDKRYVYMQFIVTFICASLLAFALEHTHTRTLRHLTSLTNQITDNSYADPLTRLLTRRAFNERFSSQLEEQAIAGKPLFIIMCDIDHFKSVNDNYGHQTGDDVLKHVSGILSKYAVGKDLCFRWGGEEFLIFLHEKSLQKAIDAANRIRVVLEYTPFLSNIAGVIKVTMSFGLHQYDTTMSMDKNISVADGYLYAAKHNGRNRVEHA